MSQDAEESRLCCLLSQGHCRVPLERQMVQLARGLIPGHHCFYCKRPIHSAMSLDCDAVQVPGGGEGQFCCPEEPLSIYQNCIAVNTIQVRLGLNDRRPVARPVSVPTLPSLARSPMVPNAMVPHLEVVHAPTPDALVQMMVQTSADAPAPASGKPSRKRTDIDWDAVLPLSFPPLQPGEEQSPKTRLVGLAEREHAMRKLILEQYEVADPSVSRLRLMQKTKQFGTKYDTRRLLCYFNSPKRGGCPFYVNERIYAETNAEGLPVSSYEFRLPPSNCEGANHSEHLQTGATYTHLLVTGDDIDRYGRISWTGELAERMVVRFTKKPTKVEVAQASGAFQRLKLEIALPRFLAKNSYGAMATVLEDYLYEEVIANPTTSTPQQDRVFLCADYENSDPSSRSGVDGDHYRLGSEDGLALKKGSAVPMVAVFTTEALILNWASAHYARGNEINLMVDASYKYTPIKRMGYIPVKVPSPTQCGLTIAYAIMTREDSAAHAFITRACRHTLEKIVHSRRMKKETHVDYN
jgi:hypothetical protein